MTFHRLSLALVVALAASAAILPARPAAASGEVALTCFPHAPAEVRYDNTWGAARSGGRGHKGTDILSPKGTAVLAVADGTVVGLENGSSSGYYVRLAHDGGWETYYMHLDNDTPGTDDGRGGPERAFAPGLAVGDTVRAGDHIGNVGDSGNAEWTSAHTHFELHIGGGAVNPYPYVVDVERRLAELTVRVTAAATLGGAGMAALRRDDLWDDLLADPALACLPQLDREAIERTFGEGVLGEDGDEPLRRELGVSIDRLVEATPLEELPAAGAVIDRLDASSPGVGRPE